MNKGIKRSGIAIFQRLGQPVSSSIRSDSVNHIDAIKPLAYKENS